MVQGWRIRVRVWFTGLEDKSEGVVHGLRMESEDVV